MFRSSGVWRPRGDDNDVVVYFHISDGACDAVYGSPVEDARSLVRLGSLADYQGNVTPIVQQSDFVFDLSDGPEGEGNRR